MADPFATSTRATAPYTYRPPSPPYIHVPITLPSGQASIRLMPDLAQLDAADLTTELVQTITNNTSQIATDESSKWVYESRRRAQRILDFLYLGPSSVVRDHGWLRDHDITMILVARDARLAQARLMTVDRASAALGIRGESVDIDSSQNVIKAFPEAVRKINDHLVAVYQAYIEKLGRAAGGVAAPAQEDAAFRPGRVLVVCETGNDRSAALVAGYIMAVFGTHMVTTVQFISIQRFCVNFDEDVKRTLQTWDDVLRARRQVSHARRDAATAAAVANASPTPAAAGLGAMLPAWAPPARAKRGIEDSYREDAAQDGLENPGEGYLTFQLDSERYVDRHPFAPFAEVAANPTPDHSGDKMAE